MSKESMLVGFAVLVACISEYAFGYYCGYNAGLRDTDHRIEAEIKVLSDKHKEE